MPLFSVKVEYGIETSEVHRLIGNGLLKDPSIGWKRHFPELPLIYRRIAIHNPSQANCYCVK